MGEELKSWI